jgi:hypothetical protein
VVVVVLLADVVVTCGWVVEVVLAAIAVVDVVDVVRGLVVDPVFANGLEGIVDPLG